MCKHLLQEKGMTRSSMIVAVTGASGVIGGAVCKHLESSGHKIVRISRNPTFADVHWSPSEGVIDHKGLNGIDAVIHLAGESIGRRRWTRRQKAEIYKSRINGTQLIARAVTNLDAPPKVFLSGSAIGFYGDCGSDKVDESFPKGSGFLAEVAADWEESAKTAEEAGIRMVHLRTGIVLDPTSGVLQRMLPLFRLGVGGKLGNGNQYWSWITLEDEARLISWLLSNQIEGPINLAAPNPVTNSEFTKTLGQVLGKPTMMSVPRFGPEILIGKEFAKELIFMSTRAIPSIALSHGFEFAYPHLDAALKRILKK